jgi:hypothetical protein
VDVRGRGPAVGQPTHAALVNGWSRLEHRGVLGGHAFGDAKDRELRGGVQGKGGLIRFRRGGEVGLW